MDFSQGPSKPKSQKPLAAVGYTSVLQRKRSRT